MSGDVVRSRDIQTFRNIIVLRIIRELLIMDVSDDHQALHILILTFVILPSLVIKKV